jgi:hypothetical protein
MPQEAHQPVRAAAANTPLLPKVEAPVKKDSGGKAPPSFAFLVSRRTLGLSLALYVCSLFSFSIFCNGLFTFYDIVPGLLGVFFSCNQKEYEMLNGTGHPFCYKRCSPLSVFFFKIVLGCNTFLWVYWATGEILIKMFDLELQAELEEGKRQQEVMDEFEKSKGIEIGSDRQLNVHHSPEWNQALVGWNERKKLQAMRLKYGSSRRAYSFYLLFFVVAIFNFYWILIVSPKNYFQSESWGTLNYYWDLLIDFSKLLTKSQTGLYNWLILLVIILEAGLFFAAAATVAWPKPALIRGRANPLYYDKIGINEKDTVLKVKPRELFKNPTQIVTHIDGANGGLIRDTCLLIACHKSTITKDRCESFSRTLMHALKIFPANAIFVCDNNKEKHPVDRTEEVCMEISLLHDKTGRTKINYVYIPEGNKSHAMYWTTEYWIPELVRRGEMPDFLYCMMIDDDVPLPPDLHVPNNTLNRHEDIKAVAYVIEAATESGRANQLVACQDLEYKMAGFVKQFQYLGGTAACCHGAIALWRRDVLGSKILWDHDTVFHGEDLYMGLLLHRMQANYTIAVSASAVVPTFAPERLLILFRQRVTSWDLCAQRKFMTFVREFFAGWINNTKSWILKPFMAQEVINIALDWMRLYLVVGLAVYNIFSLFMCFCVFYAILYFELIVFNYVVLRRRPDLQATKTTLIMFPFYRTFCLLFRLYALLRNVLMYATWSQKGLKISEREESVQDMPPVPPIINPDWQTVWYCNKDGIGEDDVLSNTERLVSDLCITSSVERRRVSVLVQAFMLYTKLLSENSLLSFPDNLQCLGGDSQTHIILLNKALALLSESLPHVLKELLGVKWEPLRISLSRILIRWERDHEKALFYNENLLGESENNVRLIVKNNLHIIFSIHQLVHATNYPYTHDKVAHLKQQVLNITELLQRWMYVDKKRQSTAFALEEMLSLLEDIKPQVASASNIMIPGILEKLQHVENQALAFDLEEQWRKNILSAILKMKKQLNSRLGRTRGGQSVVENPFARVARK